MPRISESEIERLVDAIGSSLVLFARQWCTCPDDALQEALMELLKQDPAPQSPKAWLFRVVRNKAMNMARAQRRRAKHESSVAGPEAWFEPESGPFGESDRVVAWIEQLPDIQRQIVTARLWGDLTFEQVAEVVDRPPATVFRLFREAIETLRQRLSTPRQPLKVVHHNKGNIA